MGHPLLFPPDDGDIGQADYGDDDESGQEAGEEAVPIGPDSDSQGEQADLEEAGLPPFHGEVLE